MFYQKIPKYQNYYLTFLYLLYSIFYENIFINLMFNFFHFISLKIRIPYFRIARFQNNIRNSFIEEIFTPIDIMIEFGLTETLLIEQQIINNKLFMIALQMGQIVSNRFRLERFQTIDAFQSINTVQMSRFHVFIQLILAIECGPSPSRTLITSEQISAESSRISLRFVLQTVEQIVNNALNHLRIGAVFALFSYQMLFEYVISNRFIVIVT